MTGRGVRVFDDLVVFEDVTGEFCMSIIRNETEAKLEVRAGMASEIFASHAKEASRFLPIDALFGIYRLLSGSYAVLVTGSRVVGKWPGGQECRLATNYDIIPLFSRSASLSDEQQEDEESYLKMLQDMFTAHHFFFSYGYDVTHSLQRIATMAPATLKAPIWERADTRFFWNRAALSELIEQRIDFWITPMMSAHLEFREGISAGNSFFGFIFVSRRSCRRQGCRFTMRGVDKDGEVANFAETEQILVHRDGRINALVQIRGSIPVIWNSPVTMKYAPRVVIADAPLQTSLAFKSHVEDLIWRYNRVTAVNLIDGKGDQKRLAVAFKESADKFGDERFKLVWFDFHHECRKMKFENLSKLVKIVDDCFERDGFFEQNSRGEIVRLQNGVFRTNCMDNLDRTNVVQSVFARRSAMLQLGHAGGSDSVLESPFKSFEIVFKDVWGNNADAISLLYAGTGALKTDFTRTGKRTKKGAFSDFLNSCMRYYLNNFADGHKQDSLDLLLCKFVPDARKRSPLRAHKKKISDLMIRVFLGSAAAAGILVYYFTPVNSPSGPSFTALALAYLTFVGAALFVLVKKGSKFGAGFCDRPTFCPENL